MFMMNLNQQQATRGNLCKLTSEYAVIDASGLGTTLVYAGRRNFKGVDEATVGDLTEVLSPGSSVFFLYKRVKENSKTPQKRRFRLYSFKWWPDPGDNPRNRDVSNLENCIGFVTELKAHSGMIWAKEANYVWFSQKVCDLCQADFERRFEPGFWVQFSATPQEERNGACWLATKVGNPIRPAPLAVEMERTRRWTAKSRLIVGAVYSAKGFGFGWSPQVGRVLLSRKLLGDEFDLVNPKQEWLVTIELQNSSSLIDAYWHAIGLEPLPSPSVPLIDGVRVVECDAEVTSVRRSFGLLKNEHYGSIFFNYNDIYRFSAAKDVRQLVPFGSRVSVMIVPQLTTHGCCWRALYVRPSERLSDSSGLDASSSASVSPTAHFVGVDVGVQTEPAVADRLVEIAKREPKILSLLCRKYPNVISEINSY